MENTIAMEVVQNEEVTPVIEQATKSSVNGGIIAVGVVAATLAGYGIWKGVKKLKAVCAAKKAEKEAAAKEHEFCVPTSEQ